MGYTDEALKRFDADIEICRTSGRKPVLAWSLTGASERLAARDDPGDAEKATELQDEAIAIATQLGMKPLLVRVLAQREMLKA